MHIAFAYVCARELFRVWKSSCLQSPLKQLYLCDFFSFGLVRWQNKYYTNLAHTRTLTRGISFGRVQWQRRKSKLNWIYTHSQRKETRRKRKITEKKNRRKTHSRQAKQSKPLMSTERWACIWVCASGVSFILCVLLFLRIWSIVLPQSESVCVFLSVLPLLSWASWESIRSPNEHI